MGPARWEGNRLVGWISLTLGAGSGLVFGLWSFDGPVAVPAWLGEYGDTARRLARLGHIAFFGLGLINLFVAAQLERGGPGGTAARAASVSMNLGNVFLPLTLFAAAAHRPFKYLLPLPALSVFVALLLVTWGARRAGRARDSESGT